MFLGLVQDIGLGQIHPLIQLNNRWSLTNNNNVFALMSNVCPHQNSLLTIKPCQESVTCPYHGLKFNVTGEGLDTQSVFNKHGMLFSTDEVFNYPIDLSYMQLVEQRIDAVDATKDIVLDVFLDIDHIPIAHPGVYDKINITDISKIQYDFFSNGSHQYVYADNTHHIIDSDCKYGLGALWTTVYPHTTIEWQPGALFVNVALDNNVIVYKYKDTRYPEPTWKINSDIWEEAWQQDKDLCAMIIELPNRNLTPLKQHHRDAIKK
jgi:nitrite reductase/ring-hydroxylating ferredoxin subunit